MLIVHVRLKYEIHGRAVQVCLRAYSTDYTDYRMMMKELSPNETMMRHSVPPFQLFDFSNMCYITRFPLDCGGAGGECTRKSALPAEVQY